MYDGTMHGMMTWFGPIVGVLSTLLLLALLVLAVVWLYQQVSADGSGGRPPDRDPLEILEHRYAKGEIDRDEYRRMKEELG